MATSRKIITPVFRVSYAHIWTPTQSDAGKDVYSVTAIFNPDADLKALRELEAEVRKSKWPNAKPTDKFKSPFREGTWEEYDLDKNPEYAGKIIATFRSYGRPVGVVGPDRQPIVDQKLFYSGCFAIASVTAYPYERQGNKGVSFGLANIMKMRDGDPLAGSHNAEVDFKEVKLEDYGISADKPFGDVSEDDLQGL